MDGTRLRDNFVYDYDCVDVDYDEAVNVHVGDLVESYPSANDLISQLFESLPKISNCSWLIDNTTEGSEYWRTESIEIFFFV